MRAGGNEPARRWRPRFVRCLHSTCEELIDHALEQQIVLGRLGVLVEAYDGESVAAVVANLICIVR